MGTDGLRDCAHLGEALAIPVLGVDRPGGGNLLPRVPRPRTSEEYLKLVGQATIDPLVAAIDQLSPKRIIAFGRSAGALAALALPHALAAASMNEILIDTVYAAEPVGTFATTPSEGAKIWSQYKKNEKNLIDNPQATLLVRPEPTDTKGFTRLHRTALMLPHYFNDRRYNGRIWPQPLVIQYASRAGTANTRVVIDFARTSMVLPPGAEESQKIKDLLSRILDENENGSKLVVSRRTTHRSFDSREYFNNRLASEAGIPHSTN